MRPSKIFQLLISGLALLRWEAKGAVEVLVNDANEIAVDLAAFQILYTTVEGHACSLDQFRLVAATRQHLTSLLGRQDPNFIGLELQHTLRSTIISGSSDPIFRNGTRAVFVGRAIYNETAPSADAMRDMENLCFLGENQTAYVKSLQELGCTTLEQAHLMTSAGEGVVLSHDDDEEEEEKNNNEDADNADSSSASSENNPPQSSSNPPSTTTSQGDNDTSKSDIILITVIALLVPVSLLLFLLMVYIVRQQIVTRVNWEAIKKKVSDKDSYWRADHPMALERMKVISSGFEPEVLENCKCISTDDSGSSSAYILEEQHQKQQKQTRSSPQRSSPQRRQQSRLALELASGSSSSGSGQDNDDEESAEICSTSSITVHV